MLALIMAGGEGRRLGRGEKPLVTILGQPMISYVIEAFGRAGIEVIVVATPKTCYTQNWCRARGITLYRSQGRGYVEDLVETVSALGEKAPLFTCGCDIPCITPSAIETIRRAHAASGCEACSVWVPTTLARSLGLSPEYTEKFQGVEVSPAGINILLGAKISRPQPELQLVLDDPTVAFNINTPHDLVLAARFLAGTGVEN